MPRRTHGLLCRVTGSRTTIVLELVGLGAKAYMLPDDADSLALELIRKADASRALAKLSPTKKRKARQKAKAKR